MGDIQKLEQSDNGNDLVYSASWADLFAHTAARLKDYDKFAALPEKTQNIARENARKLVKKSIAAGDERVTADPEGMQIQLTMIIGDGLSKHQRLQEAVARAKEELLPPIKKSASVANDGGTDITYGGGDTIPIHNPFTAFFALPEAARNAVMVKAKGLAEQAVTAGDTRATKDTEETTLYLASVIAAGLKDKNLGLQEATEQAAARILPSIPKSGALGK